MHEILEKIKEIGIVPVVALDDADDALPLAEALSEGGLPCAEITFRTAAAEEAIRRISDRCPQMLVGAGTVLTTDQADRAAAAGARFLVSPGFNPRVVRHCVEKGYLITPGCSTPSDMEQAIENGLKVVKFFPAEPAGGLGMIRALAAPYKEIQFMPTGGISPANAGEYLRYERILACGGTWMVKEEMIREKAFDKIKELSQEAAKIVQTSRGRDR